MRQWMGLLVNGQVVAAPQSVSVKHKNTWFGSRSFSIDIVSHFFVLCVKDSQVKEAKRFDPWHENERETIIIRNVRHSRHSRHVRRNSGSLFNNGIVRMLLYLCPKNATKTVAQSEAKICTMGSDFFSFAVENAFGLSFLARVCARWMGKKIMFKIHATLQNGQTRRLQF